MDVDTLVSTMKNFERKPKKKPSNDNANAYKVFKPRRISYLMAYALSA